jgi:hypothetical protein
MRMSRLLSALVAEAGGCVQGRAGIGDSAGPSLLDAFTLKGIPVPCDVGHTAG